MIFTALMMVLVEKQLGLIVLLNRGIILANLEIKNLVKSYDGKNNILKNISFNIKDGDLVSILDHLDVVKLQHYELLLA